MIVNKWNNEKSNKSTAGNTARSTIFFLFISASPTGMAVGLR